MKLLLWIVPCLLQALAVSSRFSGLNEAQNVLWVVAHPDDEALFFAPSITSLVKQGKTGHILSLSTGDAEGQGSIRARELQDSCALFGIQPGRCRSMDLRALPDSMSIEWRTQDVQAAVLPFIKEWQIDVIITFDSYGVSGHTNHRAIARALQEGDPLTPVYQLKSSSLLAKYSSIFGVPFGLLQDRQSSRNSIKFFATPRDFAQAVRAFRKHSSQSKWFRSLYCIFSRYLWWNELLLSGNRVDTAAAGMRIEL